MIDFSVVIPTCNRPELLALCLDRLRPGIQSFDADRYEVIVSDDSTNDSTQKLVATLYPWCRYTPGPRRGPAANRNHGASLASGQWLVFTDDDCLPVPIWLSAFAEHRSNGVIALEGAVRPLGDLDGDLVHCPTNLFGGCFWSANIAIRHDYFQRLSGFDASYPMPAYEDTDLRLRIERETKIPFVRTAVVDHPVTQLSLRRQLKSIPAYANAFAHHARKHSDIVIRSGPLRYFLGATRTSLRQFLHAIVNRRWRSASLAIAQMIVATPLGLIYLYRKAEATSGRSAT